MPLYKEELLDHFRFPRHKGILQDPDVSSAQYNPSCGDEISFQMKLKDGLITSIAFQGSGCVISQATASMLAQAMYQQPIESALRFNTTDLQVLIGIELGPTRLKCALLSLTALQDALRLSSC